MYIFIILGGKVLDVSVRPTEVVTAIISGFTLGLLVDASSQEITLLNSHLTSSLCDIRVKVHFGFGLFFFLFFANRSGSAKQPF